MESLAQFIKSYIPKADISELVSSFSDKITIKKNTIYIHPSNYCGFIAFIEKGLFRVYFQDDSAREITTWFSYEGMVITDLLSFYTGKHASFFVQALEDAEVRKISKSKLESLYESRPEYAQFGRKFAEEACVMTMQRMLSFYHKEAEDQYLELLEQPELLRRVPLKHLASYIGITDSSLSRIRRKLSLG